MSIALDLHHESPNNSTVTPLERETRRRLFWTCYLMDRFTACGSKRPSYIADKSIILRLPSWSPNNSALPLDGELFSNGSNIKYHSDPGQKGQGSDVILIDIARILGITNQYLATGGVKGDSHFPWHSQSDLSRIRQDLDTWASGTQHIFSSVDTLSGQPDSMTFVLSKLVYHLIHCMICRPFLPVDLAALSGTGQGQSWQLEATYLSFFHANAIVEVVEVGTAPPTTQWPSFVGYCICTAGTVHAHGAHYNGREGEVFSSSADFLSREMHQLSRLQSICAGAQYQNETLQRIYGCHLDLLKSLRNNPTQILLVSYFEDFFDRYPGHSFDGSHVTFADIVAETEHER